MSQEDIICLGKYNLWPDPAITTFLSFGDDFTQIENRNGIPLKFSLKYLAFCSKYPFVFKGKNPTFAFAFEKGRAIITP
jgi:hypothetical protein